MAAGFPVDEKTNTESRNASWHLHKGILKGTKEMVFCTWTCSCGVTYSIGNTMPYTRKEIWHQLGLYVYDYFSDFSNLLLDRSVKGIKSKGLYVSVDENELT